MGNIVLLDELTINQIAAGEVIERPASVVKELVENSIDAGATNIIVEIKNGGISYLRVTDNGKGIVPDDMEIAFERHATSKIRQAQDLDVVTSMGFRGEALASIASIANVEMISKSIENDIGYRLEIEGGQVLAKEEVGCPQGTSITVQNLFFNTPVRYKFLKKDFTESGYIEDVITRIALVNPNIAIKLINTGKTVIQTSGNGDRQSVIYAIYGKDIAENIIPVDYKYEDINITGVIGKPSIARSNRSNQLFFVNKRYVKDKSLTSAAEQGFRGMITIGKYGFLVLNLQMNPQKVDVNVHPAKLEVRFQEEGKVFKAVYHAIQEALLKQDFIGGTKDQESKLEEYRPSIMKGESNSQEKQEKKGLSSLLKRFTNNEEKQDDNIIDSVYRNKMEGSKLQELSQKEEDSEKENNQEIDSTICLDNLISKIEEIQNKNRQDTKEIELKKQQRANSDEELNKMVKEVLEDEEEERTDIKQLLKREEKNTNFDEMYKLTFGDRIVNKKEPEQPNDALNEATFTKGENLSVFENLEDYKTPPYKFIGIAFSTYILFEIDNEFYMMDQHAAHERILYEKVKTNYYNEDEKDSQLMLLPDIINLTHKEMGIAKDNIEMFRKAGFMIEEFGENTIKLSGVPNMCLDLDTKELFLETLDEINTVARTAKQEIEEKFIATVACKAAVKANMALTKEEVDSLMKQLLLLPNPFTCPHGRPTVIKMTKQDIEKKFSRR